MGFGYKGLEGRVSGTDATTRPGNRRDGQLQVRAAGDLRWPLEGLGHVACCNLTIKGNGRQSAIDFPEHDVERADDRRDIGQHMPAAQEIHRLWMGERRRPDLAL